MPSKPKSVPAKQSVVSRKQNAAALRELENLGAIPAAHTLPSAKWVCYVIRSLKSSHTYVGISNQLHRRLRQHNGLIKGGAKYTRGRGPWALVCFLTAFPSESAVKQLEWRLHHLPKQGRRRPRGGGIAWRLEKLAQVLAMERWTQTSPARATLDLQLYWHGLSRPAQFNCPAHVRERQLEAQVPLSSRPFHAYPLLALVVRHGALDCLTWRRLRSTCRSAWRSPL